jgi:hypothetical protein
MVGPHGDRPIGAIRFPENRYHKGFRRDISLGDERTARPLLDV